MSVWTIALDVEEIDPVSAVEVALQQLSVEHPEAEPVAFTLAASRDGIWFVTATIVR